MHVLGSIVLLAAAWVSGSPKEVIIAFAIGFLVHACIALFLSD